MGPVTGNASCSRRTVQYLADICWQISAAETRRRSVMRRDLDLAITGRIRPYRRDCARAGVGPGDTAWLIGRTSMPGGGWCWAVCLNCGVAAGWRTLAWVRCRHHRSRGGNDGAESNRCPGRRPDRWPGRSDRAVRLRWTGCEIGLSAMNAARSASSSRRSSGTPAGPGVPGPAGPGGLRRAASGWVASGPGRKSTAWRSVSAANGTPRQPYGNIRA
jgi:hypothetical protein